MKKLSKRIKNKLVQKIVEIKIKAKGNQMRDQLIKNCQRLEITQQKV